MLMPIGYTLYSLFIALVNDFLEPRFLVRASAGLISLHAIGAIFGPILASLLISAIGSHELFVCLAITNTLLLVVAINRIIVGRDIPKSTSEPFVSLPNTNIGFIEMDPRQEDD